MMLNGGRLNAQVVNGSRRWPIYATAMVAMGLRAEGEGRVEVRGQGAAELKLGTDLHLRAVRPATGTATTQLVSSLDGVRLRLVGGELDLSIVHLDSLSYRVTRRASGSAVFRTHLELTPQFYQGGAAQSLLTLRTELQGFAQRYATAQAELATHSTLAPSVYRVAAGRPAQLGLQAFLHYARTQLGYGTAVLALHARADVGVEFIDGAAAIYPMRVDLEAQRLRWAPGHGVIQTLADLRPSAVRRPATSLAAVLHTDGALDPTHITVSGVRYITPDARAAMSLHGVDAGMRRRLTSGAFNPVTLPVRMFGSGRRGRTSGILRGATSLLFQGDLGVARLFPESPAVLVLGAEGSGEVVVRGEGQAALQTSTSLHGRAKRRATGTAVVASLSVQGTGYRRRRAQGGAAFEIDLEPAEGVRRRTGQGAWPIVLVADESEAGVVRAVAGGALLALHVQCDGEVFVEGTGSSVSTLDATGTGRVVRFISGAAVTPLLASGAGDVLVRGVGNARTTLQADLDALVRRVFDGAAEIVLESDGGGEVYVRGEGAAHVRLYAEGEGYRVRRIQDVGEMVVETELAVGAIQRSVSLRLPLPTVLLHAEGIIRRGIAGDAVMQALGESSAYINIASTDVDSQTFVRPADPRVWLRPADVRLFRRVV